MSTPEERELSEFASRLARYRAVRVPPEFRSRLRASLIAAPVVLDSRRPSLFRWSRSFALRPIVASVLVLALLAMAGGGVAAASSLPGDPAFALKRAAEDVEVALAWDDISRLDTVVMQSGRRLVDLETLAARRSSAVAVATDEYLAAASRFETAVTRVAALAASAARDAALARAEASARSRCSRPCTASPLMRRAVAARPSRRRSHRHVHPPVPRRLRVAAARRAEFPAGRSRTRALLSPTWSCSSRRGR